MFGGQARTLLKPERGDQDDRREQAMAAAARASWSGASRTMRSCWSAGRRMPGAIAAAYAKEAPSPTPPPCEGEGPRFVGPSPSHGGGVAGGGQRHVGCGGGAGRGADRADPVLVSEAERAGRRRGWQSGAVVLSAGLDAWRRLRTRRRDGRWWWRAALAGARVCGLACPGDRRVHAGLDAGQHPREAGAGRGRDPMDAAVACFGQGHGDAVSEAMRQVLIGDAIGRITGGRADAAAGGVCPDGRAAAAADP